MLQLFKVYADIQGVGDARDPEIQQLKTRTQRELAA